MKVYKKPYGELTNRYKLQLFTGFILTLILLWVIISVFSGFSLNLLFTEHTNNTEVVFLIMFTIIIVPSLALFLYFTYYSYFQIYKTKITIEGEKIHVENKYLFQDYIIDVRAIRHFNYQTLNSPGVSKKDENRIYIEFKNGRKCKLFLINSDFYKDVEFLFKKCGVKKIKTKMYGGILFQNLRSLPELYDEMD